MSRSTTLTVIAGFVVGLVLGCGSSKPPDVSGGDPAPKPADLPKAPLQDELPAAEAKLAELDRTIAAKEKELANLKAEADTLRQSIAAAKAPKDNVYRTADGLFADMPKDASPKYDSAVHNAKARKWLKENFKGGQVVEWKTKVTSVKDSGSGPFSVTLTFDVPTTKSNEVFRGEYGSSTGWSLGEPIPLGGQLCQVMMAAEMGPIKLPAKYLDTAGGPCVTYYDCTEDEVAKLKALEGKPVHVRGKIASKTKVTWALDEKEEYAGALLGERVTTSEKKDLMAIVFFVHQLSVDGFLPKASLAKEGK
jgi:hypothetical protein